MDENTNKYVLTNSEIGSKFRLRTRQPVPWGRRALAASHNTPTPLSMEKQFTAPCNSFKKIPSLVPTTQTARGLGLNLWPLHRRQEGWRQLHHNLIITIRQLATCSPEYHTETLPVNIPNMSSKWIWEPFKTRSWAHAITWTNLDWSLKVLCAQSTFKDKSTLVQVMARCRQATGHYLIKYWLKSINAVRIFIKYIFQYGNDILCGIPKRTYEILPKIFTLTRTCQIRWQWHIG